MRKKVIIQADIYGKPQGAQLLSSGLVLGFFVPHIYIIYFVGKQGILISKKIKLTKEETYKVSQREGKQEME